MPPPPLQDGRPTLTVSQRRQSFEECRFLDVRHLAYLHYKKPGTDEPLLRYEETLDNREMVKQTVLGFEISQGWLIPDGTEGQIQVPAQPQPQTVSPPPAVPQGAPQMNQPFNPPPNGAPVPQPQMAPAPMPQQPQYAMPQPQMQQPPPQQMQVPQPQYAAPAPQQMMQPPPVANPQQAAAAGAPPQQEAPATAPTGRRRKGQGTAVAPPPAAPPPPPQGVPVQQFAPPQQMAMQLPPPQAAPAPFGAPPPMQGGPAPYQPQAQQPVPQQMAPPPQAQQAAPTVDLSQVTGRVDALAKIVEVQGKQLAEARLTSEIALGVLHHLYLVNPQLQPQQGQPQLPRTLPEFKKYFQQFVGTPS